MVKTVFDCCLFGVLTGLAFLIMILTDEIGEGGHSRVVFFQTEF